jgi:hypothetical protein
MKSIYLLSVLAVLSSCSTNQFQDFIVKERNPDPAPEWSKDFTKWKNDNEGKGKEYFLGESGDVNDRISGCEVAALNAKAKIARQIAEFITGKLAFSKSGMLFIDPTNSQDPGVRRAYENNLATKALSFLSGVKEYSTFWELRDYSKSNGHKRVFNCSVVVSIADKDFQKSTRKAADEMIEDPEAKASVKESLKELDKDFSNYKSRN